MGVNLLLKFGKKNRLESFIEKGEVYFNKPSEYRKFTENERGDPFEGAEWIQNGGFTKIEFDHPAIGKGELPIKKGSGKLIQNSDYFLSYSLYEISTNFFESEEPIKIDERLCEFGDSGVLIHNKKAFISKLINELNRLNISWQYGVVEYMDLNKEGKHNPTPFIKNELYSHQREFRIIIQNPTDQAKLISVGSLVSVCHKFDSGYVIGSKELTELQWDVKRMKQSE